MPLLFWPQEGSTKPEPLKNEISIPWSHDHGQSECIIRITGLKCCFKSSAVNNNTIGYCHWCPACNNMTSPGRSPRKQHNHALASQPVQGHCLALLTFAARLFMQSSCTQVTVRITSGPQTVICTKELRLVSMHVSEVCTHQWISTPGLRPG